jgi:hypothetical protein
MSTEAGILPGRSIPVAGSAEKAMGNRRARWSNNSNTLEKYCLILESPGFSGRVRPVSGCGGNNSRCRDQDTGADKNAAADPIVIFNTSLAIVPS